MLRHLVFKQCVLAGLTFGLLACGSTDNPDDFKKDNNLGAGQSPAPNQSATPTPSPVPTATPVATPTPTPSPTPTPDIVITQPESLVINTVSLQGASLDGSTGDVLFAVKTIISDERDENQLPVLLIEIFNSANEKIASSTPAPMSAGETTQQISITVPSQNNTLKAVAKFYNNTDTGFSNPLGQADFEFTVTFPRLKTNLNAVMGVRLEIIPGSYATEEKGGRRIHYFSAQVFDQNGISINGLEDDTRGYFTAYEDGIVDEESGVTVSSRENRITVYMVMDVSSSITQAGADQALLQAASKTTASLSDFTSFNYREFSSDVRPINSLQELTFETGVSGTALFWALDSALKDIESASADVNDKVIIVFTDGRDLSSQNHYPDLNQPEDVLPYIDTRISAVKDNLHTAQAGSLITHFVGLGEHVDQDALAGLAQTGGGGFLLAENQADLDSVFSALANLIQSTYQLEYSSQQLQSGNVLELEVNINGLYMDRKVVNGE